MGRNLWAESMTNYNRGGNAMEQTEQREQNISNKTEAVPQKNQKLENPQKTKRQTEVRKTQPLEQAPESENAATGSANSMRAAQPNAPDKHAQEYAQEHAREHYAATQKLLQAPDAATSARILPTSLRGKQRLCARLQKLPQILVAFGLAILCFLFSYWLASRFLFSASPALFSASSALTSSGNEPSFGQLGALLQLWHGLLSSGNHWFPLLLFAVIAGLVTLCGFLLSSFCSFSSWVQKRQKQKNKFLKKKFAEQFQISPTEPQKLSAPPHLPNPKNLRPASMLETPEATESPESQKAQTQRAAEAQNGESPVHEKLPEELHKEWPEEYQSERQAEPPEVCYPNAARHTAEPEQPQESRESKESGELEEPKEQSEWSGRFSLQLQFLLGKKAEYRRQRLLVIGFGLLGALLALAAALPALPGPSGFRVFAALLFGTGFAFGGKLCAMLLRGQYKQGMESRFHSALQQLYQPPHPAGAHNQTRAVHTLYALAFVEAESFEQPVHREFQNILKQTRNPWYQNTYSECPSVLVEETLRCLLSAVDFGRLSTLWAGKAAQKQNRQTGIATKTARLWQQWRYYKLFLKNFQTFRAFREGATVSLLNCIPNENISPKAVRRKKGQKRGRFVLENYYFVGVNLSGLRITEAHFQNCRLIRSNWAHSDTSDCSLSSCLLDQAILSGSSWRRFLWNANTAREAELEGSFLLQGNIECCDLQGTQNRTGTGWIMRHCLLRECRISHSVFLLDNWQGVTASGCEGHSTLISLRGQLCAWENLENGESRENEENGESSKSEENIREQIGKHLEIKEAKA